MPPDAPPPPQFTITVCTWNRAASLRQTLRSFLALDAVPGAAHEILVVDNNSRDDTAAVLAEFAGALPLRVVHEPRQGLSHARNRAVASAHGAAILWTDDDVQVRPDWLAAYAAALHRHPEADLFGGVIHPRFDGRPPRWLRAGWTAVQDAYAARDLGPAGFELEPVVAQLPYGANFAVRTALLRRYGFDPALGLIGSHRQVGDETALLAQMMHDGARGRWVAGAVVYHRVPRHRQRLSFVRAHYRAAGRMLWSLPLPLASGHAPPGPRQPARLRRRRRRALRACYLERALLRPPMRWLPHLIEAESLRGELETAPITAP